MKSSKNPDLHYTKESHMSAPVTHGMEWHLERADDPQVRNPDKTYTLCVPAVCTSSDADGNRFRQINKPYVEDRPTFDDSRTSSGKLDSVADKMRSKEKKGTKFVHHEDIGSPVKKYG